MKEDCGFILIVVIACIGLLAVAAATFSKVTRAQIRSRTVAVEVAHADALAEAGVNFAVLKLLAYRANPNGADRDFAVNGKAFTCSLERDTLVFQALDEGGKVDLNFANERLLRALLIGLDTAPPQADALVDAILDYRDGDDVKRLRGAEKDAYLAAGRLLGPKNAPFSALEELNQVLGMGADLVLKMSPYVTIYSGRDGVDPVAAPRKLVGIIKRGDTNNTPDDIGDDPQSESRASDLPSRFIAGSARRVFTVRSEVATAGGVRYAREAIVDISPQSGGRIYRLWRWRRAPSAGALEASADHPPCRS